MPSPKMLRRSILVVLMAWILGSVGSPAAEIDQKALDRAVEATVFVKTERAFQHQRFPASGSGFFISPEGYVLTNWHVIADQFSGYLWGRERELSAKVLRLWVVVDSGTPQEREIPAKVVVRNRTLDLALLKVPYHPKAFLDVTDVAEPHLAQPIWIVGFPYGSLMSALKEPGAAEPESNPEVSIASGMVTSFRRDAKSELAGVQIDAPVNPGNSGGPMLTAEGRLAGVVFAKFSRGEGLGLAVPWTHIRQFVKEQMVKVRFAPTAVLTPPSPITVTAEPILADFAASSGTLQLTGGDIPPSAADFSTDGDRLTATVPFPKRITGRPLPDSYLAAVVLRDATGNVVFRRRYRLKRVDTAATTLRSERDPSEMMEDRRLLGNEMEIKDYAEARSASQKKGALADVARKLKLQRDESGKVVIDNHAVKRAAAFTPNPADYEALPAGDLRDLAEEYDATRARLGTVRERLQDLKSPKQATGTLYYGAHYYYYSYPWSNGRISQSERKKLIPQYQQEEQRLLKRLPGMKRETEHRGICRCPDGHWFLREASPCGCPPLAIP